MDIIDPIPVPIPLGLEVEVAVLSNLTNIQPRLTNFQVAPPHSAGGGRGRGGFSANRPYQSRGRSGRRGKRGN